MLVASSREFSAYEFLKNLCSVLMKCKIRIKHALFLELQCYIFNLIVEIVFLKAVSPIRSLGCIQHPGHFIWFMHFSEKAEKFNLGVFSPSVLS